MILLDWEYLFIDLNEELAKMDCPWTIWLIGDAAICAAAKDAWPVDNQSQGEEEESCWEELDSIDVDLVPPLRF